MTRVELGSDPQEAGFGFVPAAWRTVRLGDLAEVKYGRATPHSSGTIPVVGSGGVFAWTNQALVDYPTLVIGRKGAAGKVWFMERPSWPSDTTFYLGWKQEVDVQFVFGYLNLRPLSGQHAKTTLPSLQRPDLENCLIPLPPLPEQRRIAHVLSTIQRAIQAQDAVIAAARELKRSLMQRLFTYGPYAEPLPTKETDFGEVPRSWPEVGLEHCAKIQTGVAKGRKLDGADTVELPYLRVANVQDGYLDLDEIKTLTILRTEMHRFRLQDRDVLLTEGGDFDKLGRGFIWRNQLDPCIHQNHIFAVRTHRSVLLPEFFSYLVQSVYGKRYFLKVAHRTTNLASINSTKLKALPVLLASMDEQRTVVNMLGQVDCKVAMEERRGAALVALFKSMLHQLMTGQVRVPAVDK